MDELALTAEDAEQMMAHAGVLRAAAVGSTNPIWRAQKLAEAVALEGIATQATAISGPVRLGNGGEVMVRVPLDAPWKEQEVCRATREAPALLNAEATVERLELARDAQSLALAADAAQRSDATTPAEQMLAHQMATSHSLAMKLAAKAQVFLAREFVSYLPHVGDGREAQREQTASIEAARLATAAARMMEATARAAFALDRLKNGSRQTIVVQQKVDVQAGGQAVVNGAVEVQPRRSKRKHKS